MRVRLLIAMLLLMPLGASALAQTAGIREVTASGRAVIPLDTKIRYTTMIVLPDDEEILDVVCGDRDFWVISAAQNIAHVKPAKEGAATNLNLITSSGNVYSFLLRETRTAQPDLKLYVTADPQSARGPQRYFSATQVVALQTELRDAHATIEAARRAADEQVASFRQQYPASLRFAYGSPKFERPFFVRSIWHDGQFTYIKSDAPELPALYEITDGQPAVINFQVQDGTYIVPKVIQRGYLALGKDRFNFQQGR
ncbi:MAG: TrbG/VirB9 family P-type conjugative transfer protein [Rhodospirillaceae bacterium]